MNTIAQVACNFTTNRMLTDYCEKFYYPQAERTQMLVGDDYAIARKISAWKSRMRRYWDDIEVISQKLPEASYSLDHGSDLNVEVVLNLGNIKPEEIGVEVLVATTDRKRQLHIQDVFQSNVVEYKDGIATYHASVEPQRAGMYQFAVRMYAMNELLPHRQDFELVKWL